MKTNKILALCIVSVLCLLTLFTIVGSDNLLTAQAEVNSGHDIYFIHPTAIALVGDYLFVADNVDDNNTRGVLWSFSLNENGAPVDGKQLDIGDNGSIVGLSGSNLTLSEDSSAIGSLYIVYASNKAVLYDVKTIDGKVAVSQNLNSKTTIVPDAGEQLADACIVQYSNLTTVSYATDNCWYFLDPAYNFVVRKQSNFKNTVAMFYGDNHTYLVRKDNSVVAFDMSDLSNTTLNIDFGSTEFDVTNGFVFYDGSDNKSIAVYNSEKIVLLQQQGNGYTPYGTSDSWDNIVNLTDVEDMTILDTATSDGRWYILDSDHRVVLYNKESATTAATVAKNSDGSIVFIGSDTVTQNIPEVKQITNYKLVKSVGYPTNIVYKTTDETTSIIGGVKDLYTNDTFIVLEYDGSTNCPYYYVLLGDKFGWVMKSDGATVAEEDNKLTVLSSKVNDIVDMTAKLTSLSDVYIYSLPYTNATKTKYTQSAQSQTEVKLLQTFRQTVSTNTDGTTNAIDIVWYLVTFTTADNTTMKGFVMQSDIGYFSVDPKSTIGLEVHKANLKINATLFEAVTVYATSDMTKGAELYNSQGNIVKLYSGDRVFLLGKSADEVAAQICILHNDNTADYGWIDASRLIDTNQITANTIAGLCFLGGACLLALLLLVVFKVKKNKNN